MNSHLHPQNSFNDEEFTDVTLVTDDDKEINAHKTFFSSCSTIVKNVTPRALGMDRVEQVVVGTQKNCTQLFWVEQSFFGQNKIVVGGGVPPLPYYSSRILLW